jgi:hypothetical protein
MARYKPAEPVYHAAQLWAQTCLLGEGSTDESLWNKQVFAGLDRYYVRNLDEGEGDFFGKLEKQLAPASGSVKKLAAEVLATYLYPHQTAMNVDTKCAHLRRIWDGRDNHSPNDRICFRSRSPAASRHDALNAGRFPHVSPLRITAADFCGIMIHRNNRFYRFLLDVCRLIHENLISDERAPGALRFRDFREDEAKMHKLFEDFVRNFLKAEQSEFKVHSPKISWNVSDTDDYSRSFLPDMQTDIVLENEKLVRIIDTKFYSKPLAGHYDVRKLHSQHLYQLQSCVHNWPHPDRSARRDVDGLLLYAATDATFRLRYRILGRPIAAMTLALDAEWAEVRESLLSVCRSS